MVAWAQHPEESQQEEPGGKGEEGGHHWTTPPATTPSHPSPPGPPPPPWGPPGAPPSPAPALLAHPTPGGLPPVTKQRRLPRVARRHRVDGPAVTSSPADHSCCCSTSCTPPQVSATTSHSRGSHRSTTEPHFRENQESSRIHHDTHKLLGRLLGSPPSPPKSPQVPRVLGPPAPPAGRRLLHHRFQAAGL